MIARKSLLVIAALTFLSFLLTSCNNNGQGNTSSCGYQADITVGNSTKPVGAGGCDGTLGSEGAAVHMKVGQTLTVHFGEPGIASARSQHSKVLELTSENSMEQSYRAISAGVSKILYPVPIHTFLLCTGGETPYLSPCVIADVTVTQLCAGESPAHCKGSHSQGTSESKGSTPPSSSKIVALAARQSPVAVMCKPGFFTKVQAQLLVQQFGLIECFRFSGEDQWVVIGNGYLQKSNTPSLGSTRASPVTAIVALENCASSDTACLDPSAMHNFANFTVHYAPYPLFRGGLYATSFGNLLSIDDYGYCRPITFDISNGKWYPSSVSEELLETDPLTATSLKVPPSVSGAEALAQKVPVATISTVSAC